MKSSIIVYVLPVLAMLGVSTVDAAWRGDYASENQQQFRQEFRQNFQEKFEDRNFSQHQIENFARRGIRKNTEETKHNLTKLLNGFRIVTMTDNKDLIEKIQERAHNKAERTQSRDDINVTVTDLSNGVQVDMTITDAEILEKMHAKVDQREIKKSIKKEVKNTSKGVKITITSDNPDALAKIQKKEPRQPRNKDISISRVNVSNGVEITITTDNEDLVEKIQQRVEQKGGAREKRF